MTERYAISYKNYIGSTTEQTIHDTDNCNRMVTSADACRLLNEHDAMSEKYDALMRAARESIFIGYACASLHHAVAALTPKTHEQLLQERLEVADRILHDNFEYNKARKNHERSMG